MKRVAQTAEVDPRFVPVVEAFAKKRYVSVGKMMSSYGLRVNGKIFAMFVKDQLVVKLPKPRVDEIVGRGLGRRFDPGHGRLMKEWVVIGTKERNWVELAGEAYDFVRGLTP